ncbi:hypothetical protein CDAR_497281 [Caerostris darwini]|uniref:Secreted protein n=1 Tax=Caerostris darwini TaxID=1538125 RepID=A0AAV4S4S9_9ARAC|nr:hypothetical protein CDAR_497281 [Caerostris darwini]
MKNRRTAVPKALISGMASCLLASDYRKGHLRREIRLTRKTFRWPDEELLVTYTGGEGPEVRSTWSGSCGRGEQVASSMQIRMDGERSGSNGALIKRQNMFRHFLTFLWPHLGSIDFCPLFSISTNRVGVGTSLVRRS